MPFFQQSYRILLSIWLLLLIGACSGTPVQAQFALPQVSNFIPITGEPGAVVIINGSGFQSAGAVSFGVGSAQFEILSDSQVRAVVPSDATTGPITVNTDRGFAVSSSFFQVSPRISSFEPIFGKVGDVIVLRGANFGGLSQVWLGDTLANFQINGETQLLFAVPTDAQSGVIRIVSQAGQAVSDESFQVIGPEPFILEFEPPMASPGELIVIRGVQMSNASKVLFTDDKQGFFSVVADTQIIVRVPADAESGPIKITTPLGEGMSANDFLILGAGPFITQINPAQGRAGDSIIVDGVNFSDLAEVLLNDEETEFQVVADTQLSFIVPESATSGFLRLKTSTEDYISDIEFQVIGPEPVIDSFTPTSGLPGTRVQFEGKHFVHVESVHFGEVEAIFESSAETQLTAIVPVDAVSGLIKVNTAFGETVTGSEFTVQEPLPEISAFTPLKGFVGTQLTITGSFLNSVTNVVIGEQVAAFEIVADSQILTVVPEEAHTGVIRVESSSGSFTTEDLFYLPVEIDQIDPPKATPGTSILLKGSNFTGTSRVRIGGVNAEIQSVNLAEVSVLVPSDGLIGPVSVTTPAGSLATQESFGILPHISEITPVAGPIGSLVQVKGAGLSEVQTVLIGMLSVDFSIQAHDLIHITIPSNAPFGQITVVNPAGLAISNESFQLRQAAELSLEVIPSANPSTWQVPNTFNIKVHNAGPSPARNFFLRHLLPSGVESISVSNPNGGVSVTGSLVTSGIVSLEAGETAEILHTVSTPHFGYQTHRFQIDADIFDPTPDNQLLDLVHPITGPQVDLDIKLKPDGKHQVSWHPMLRGYDLVSRSMLSESSPWTIVVDPTPDDESSVELENPEHDIFYTLKPSGESQ